MELRSGSTIAKRRPSKKRRALQSGSTVALPINQYAPKYHDWKIGELRVAIDARTGKATATKLDRSSCINMLRELDQHHKFRLMDLPPEMRNRIYEVLLHHDRQNLSIAFPNILRTCKQVYREAAGILYAHSRLYIAGSLYGGWRPDVAQSVTFYGDLKGRVEHRDFAGKFEFKFKAPRTVHVDLGLRLWEPRNVSPIKHSPLWCFLDNLVGGCGKVQHFKIAVHSRMSYLLKISPSRAARFERVLQASFQPLRRLSRETTLEIEGLDDRTYEAVWRSINGVEEKFGKL